MHKITRKKNNNKTRKNITEVNEPRRFIMDKGKPYNLHYSRIPTDGVIHFCFTFTLQRLTQTINSVFLQWLCTPLLCFHFLTHWSNNPTSNYSPNAEEVIVSLIDYVLAKYPHRSRDGSNN